MYSRKMTKKEIPFFTDLAPINGENRNAVAA
jgi:hypothetical protein